VDDVAVGRDEGAQVAGERHVVGAVIHDFGLEALLEPARRVPAVADLLDPERGLAHGVQVEYPQIVSTDVDDLRLLASFGEAVPLVVPDVYSWRNI
jgi:hypothetical protein